MGTITLRRTGRTVSFQGMTGEISELELDGDKFWAVERRDRFITLDDGKYTVKMEISPTHKGRRQLRVLGHHKTNRMGESAPILIHAGNTPGDVQGCIAPGLSVTNSGVEQSRPAMDKIFKSLGHFKVGQTGDLIVTHK
jgi:Family of unknown function (DUF5675)